VFIALSASALTVDEMLGEVFGKASTDTVSVSGLWCINYATPSPIILGGPAVIAVKKGNPKGIHGLLAPDADPQARQFIDFLVSDRGAEIMKTEGWVR
jgi:hypothetical protein